MIYSMTAFARGELQDSWGTLTLEMRSVNSRFLEINFRLPEELRSCEQPLRERVTTRLGRGKLDLTVRLQSEGGAEGKLTLNTPLISQLAAACRQITPLIAPAAAINPLELLGWPGVVQNHAPDSQQLHPGLLALCDSTLDELLNVRQREGEGLAQLLHQRLEAIGQEVAILQARLPAAISTARERLQSRLAALQVELDPARLEQEVVLLVQKWDVHEEIDRLQTHLNEITRLLRNSDKSIGRRLDFLIQELHREANTLGAKSTDITTTQSVIEIKVLIEQMREQVQNIE
jgi:uncharacterized protein (TIGR00255 family)